MSFSLTLFSLMMLSYVLTNDAKKDVLIDAKKLSHLFSSVFFSSAVLPFGFGFVYIHVAIVPLVVPVVAMHLVRRIGQIRPYHIPIVLRILQNPFEID